MFRRERAKTLRLRIDDRDLSFERPSDFEFALAGRCGVPLARIRGLERLDDAALKREAERLRRMSLRFTQALTDAPVGSTGLSAFLISLELSSVSQDHSWRAILANLGEFDASVDDFKRAAMARYNQYLAAREELARVLLKQRRLLRGAQSTLGPTTFEVDSPHATMVMEAATQEPVAGLASFDRLPKGQAIEVELGNDEAMTLVLVNHRCQVVGGAAPQFIDAQGHRTALPAGRTVVGRDAGSDIQIATDRRDISRKHLIVERCSGHLLRLTDISSLGTYIPPNYLDKAGSC